MTPSPDAPRKKSRRALFVLGAGAFGLIAFAASGIADRAPDDRELASWTDAQAVETVRVVRPDRGPDENSLVLPGVVKAFNENAIFARASGYVASWNEDIGAHVAKGDILATISAPDLDQQFAQAKGQLAQLQAAVDQAKALADLGAATEQRTRQLVAQGWSSKAQGDTDRLTAASRAAAVALALANVVAQQAAVDRLAELTSFEQVRAPFDGVITARNVNVGDLINASVANARGLFEIADIHRMRIYVNVPQAFIGEVRPGLTARLRLPGLAGAVEARFASTSNAVAESSRMAQFELQADNADGKLWPGAFAEVEFHLPADPGALRIPVTALIFGQHGTQVAVVDDNMRVALKPVALGRDIGDHVEVTSGITLADRLVDNPLESIASGDLVQRAGSPPQGAAIAASRKFGAKSTATD